MIFLWVFLPVVFVVNFILPKQLSNLFLLLASLFFYAWGEPVMVLLMVASIIVNWLVGYGIDRFEAQKKWILLLGIVFDLGALGYYKYAGFFAKVVNDVTGSSLLQVKQIALPIGISFFTFQAMSYIVDVYRKDTEASKSPINVALYISFFPQLIAGPIVRYHDINEQIKARSITSEKVATGFRRFVYGLGKKVLISNVLGACADTLYGYDLSQTGTLMAWIGALMYTFQIYYDFSGYSDMAIGLGKMFGFDIQENFNYPYLSKSLSEFWRRWHISLGQWFREYVYIPLGGNRKGVAWTYINLAIVFFLTGLWHGANYTFIVWGIFHGFFRLIERAGLEKSLQKSKVLSHVYLFLLVNFGWVLFRSDTISIAIGRIGRMLDPWATVDETISTWQYLNSKTLVIFAIAVLGCGILQSIAPKRLAEKWKNSVPEVLFCTVILFLTIAALAGDTYNPFIYFQF